MLKNSTTLKFLAATFVVACAFVATSAFAMDFGSTTLKVGSKGEFVKTLQTLVGANADGNFGPATAAKVKAWQAANGLTADGMFGNASKAKANATSTGSYPAGCSSNTGFSTTTGASCSSTTSYPAGCMSSVGFSSTTGMSCSGGSSSTTLSGGAGDITVTTTSTDVNDKVQEGASNVQIKGFKVEASGSDVAVSNVKVTLKNTGYASSSYRPSNYMSEVSVWMGSKKVGSANIADFTKNGYEYSKSIALNNAIVKMGVNSKATFYIAVSALSSIDTTDMNNDSWAIVADNIRFQDGTGVVMTDGTSIGSISTTAFDFESQATSGDVKVVVSKASSSPIAQNVTVSTTASTKNLSILDFKVKTTGSTASFDSLVVSTTLATAGTTGAGVISELNLVDGSGATIATLDGATIATGTNSYTFTLDDTKVIAKDTTETFHIVATVLKGVTGNFVSGANLTASFGSFSPEDSNGDVITDTGSATGAAQSFVYSVPIISLSGTPTLALFAHTDGTTTGLEDSYKATITFDVTAPDTAAVYVPLDSFAYGTAGTSGVLFTKTGGATVTSASVQYVGNDNLSSITDTNSYRVDAGATQKFALSVYLTGNDVNGKIAMTGLWYELAAGTPDGTPTVSSLTNLYTPLVYLAK